MKIFRNLNQVVLKIVQPGPIEAAGVPHNANEFPETHRDGRFRNSRKSVVLTRKQSQSRSHASPSLLPVPSSPVLVDADPSGIPSAPGIVPSGI